MCGGDLETENPEVAAESRARERPGMAPFGTAWWLGRRGRNRSINGRSGVLCRRVGAAREVVRGPRGNRLWLQIFRILGLQISRKRTLRFLHWGSVVDPKQSPRFDNLGLFRTRNQLTFSYITSKFTRRVCTRV